MRGVALTLVCPRCHTERPPAGDRRPITCTGCALVFTVEQGERAHERPRRRAASPTQLVRQPVRGVRCMGEAPLRLRLAWPWDDVFASAVAGGALSAAAYVTLPVIWVGWMIAAGAVFYLGRSLSRLRSMTVTLDAEGLRSGMEHLAVSEIVELGWAPRRTGVAEVWVVEALTVRGAIKVIARAPTEAAAREAAEWLADELARLRDGS